MRKLRLFMMIVAMMVILVGLGLLIHRIDPIFGTSIDCSKIHCVNPDG